MAGAVATLFADRPNCGFGCVVLVVVDLVVASITILLNANIIDEYIAPLVPLLHKKDHPVFCQLHWQSFNSALITVLGEGTRNRLIMMR